MIRATHIKMNFSSVPTILALRRRLAPTFVGILKERIGSKSIYFVPQSRLNLRQGPRHVPPGILVILQLPRQIIFVRAQVEVTVPAEAEQDGALPPFLAGEQGFVHGRADSVRRFRRRQDSLGARESHGG